MSIKRGYLTLAAALLLMLSVSIGSDAIEINITYDPSISSLADVRPLADPTASRLLTIVNAAANYWENIFLDDQTFDIPVVWNEMEFRLAQPSESGFAISSSFDWYFDDSDPTSVGHSEFALGFGKAQQSVYQDASPAEQASWFRGDVPGSFEYGIQGESNGSNPLAENFDLFTLAVRQIGLKIGADGGGFLGDGYWDLMPVTIGGRSVGLAVDASLDTVAAEPSLLNRFIPRGARKLPSSADILALARPNLLTNVNLPRKDFISGNQWHDASNWIGNRLPSAGDDVYIRNTDVLVNVTLGNNARMQNLFVGERAWLHTADRNLLVGEFSGGTTIVDGAGRDSNLFVEDGGTLQTGNLKVQDFGSVSVRGGEVIVFDDLINIADSNSRIVGWGNVTLFGGQRLINDGRIVGSSDPGSVLRFNTTTGGTPWDLDGASGAGSIDATFGDIEFANGGIRDEFDGSIIIGNGRQIRLASDFPFNGDAVIRPDGHLDIGGALNVAADGFIRTIDARISASELENTDGTLNLSGAVNVDSEFANRGQLFIDGLAAGSLELDGDFRQEIGRIWFDVHGNESSQIDLFAINGTADLDGQLNVQFDDDFLPAAGDVFTILTATAGISGEFALPIVRGVPSGLAWELDYRSTSLVLRILDLKADFDGDGLVDCSDIDLLTAEILAGTNNSAFDLNGDGDVNDEDLQSWLANAATFNGLSSPYLPGDANLDGSVDVSDFNTWNANKFTSSSSWCAGDFNADGAVDVADFNVWNANKFLSSAREVDFSDSRPVSVPEPSPVAGAIISILAFCLQYRHSQNMRP